MFTQEVIITIVTTMIGSGLINCILTHFLILKPKGERNFYDDVQ